ncbi:helix-turn-helix domain-containing protein [Psychrobacillus sp. FSL H8-0487]|uniref:helix-turn-helix domain-containing protein n=1 Tax=Psychrobacillus sp. FSL H8-0487 TaxID=2921391 RepID=UPI004046B403
MITVTLNDYLHKISYEGSLRELADQIGHNREKVRRFASNEMKLYPEELLSDLCDFLKCNLEDILRHKPNDRQFSK